VLTELPEEHFASIHFCLNHGGSISLRAGGGGGGLATYTLEFYTFSFVLQTYPAEAAACSLIRQNKKF